MANIALANADTTKLKHWTQAIKDLEEKFTNLENSIVPLNHASEETTYGVGSETKYGHLKIIDTLSLNYKEDGNGQFWNIALPKDQEHVGLEDGKWNDIVYHNGRFIAVGTHGRIATSEDGLNWDPIHFIYDATYTVTDENNNTEEKNYKDNPNFSFQAIEWCGNCYVAVGSYNMFTYSYDGMYWYAPKFVGVTKHSSTSITTGSPINAGYTENDIWYGVTYDELSKLVYLCGTEGRTLCAKFISGAINRFDFGTTQFNFENRELPVTLYDIAVIPKNSLTNVVCCGTSNYVLSKQMPANSKISDFKWDFTNAADNKLKIEVAGAPGEHAEIISDNENYQVIDWRKISIQEDELGKLFLLLGTNGRVVQSYNGMEDTWNVPTYDSTIDNFNINTMVGHQNLFVVAGDYSTNNIIRYDARNTNSEESELKHVSEAYPVSEPFSWYGSCYGNDKFLLCGEDNTIIYCCVSEEDDNYAISLEFYKNYIKILEDRINELENRVLTNNLEYEWLYGEEYEYGDETVDGIATFYIDGVKYALKDNTNSDGQYVTNGENSYVVDENNHFTIVQDSVETNYTIQSNGIILKGTEPYTQMKTTTVGTKLITYQSGNALLFNTYGKIELSFISAPETIYKEIMIYLNSMSNPTINEESDNPNAVDTRLSISGSGEYENDFYMPDWGRAGFHLTLKAIFVGGRVIVQIVDNDQLADNLL